MATSKFRMLTEQVAAGLDATDIRILEVPHPLGGTDEATITAWADAAVDKTLALMGASPAAESPASVPSQAPAPGAGAEAAVAQVRELVAADGGDVELVSFDGSAMKLRLILETVECQECVMPAEFLERVALDKMRESLPALVSVDIEDPRD